MNNKVETKYRSTVNPLAIGLSVILYVILAVLVVKKTPQYLPFMIVFIILMLGLDSVKYIGYKYYFDNKGLTIIHRRKRILILYKDIKYVEVDSKETHGIIYGYGVKRILIGTGRGIEEKYLITPAKEKEFIELLEKKVNQAKKNTR